MPLSDGAQAIWRAVVWSLRSRIPDPFRDSSDIVARSHLNEDYAITSAFSFLCCVSPTASLEGVVPPEILYRSIMLGPLIFDGNTILREEDVEMLLSQP